MKILTNLIVIIFLSISVYGQQENSKIIIIRDTQMMGALTKFGIFIDDQIICKLKNNRYLVTDLKPGIHKFSVQMTGKKSKNAVDHFELEIQANKTYYLKVETPASVIGSSSFTEITNNSAEKIIPTLKEQENCK